MFKKIKCPNCEEKISGNYNFCPYCRIPLNNNGDWGMLGKNDFIDEQDEFSQFMKGFGGGMLGKMFNNAIKMLEREMQKSMQEQRKIRPQTKTNIRLMINGKEINLNDGQPVQKKPKKQKIKKTLPNNKLKNFSKLPKKEPLTNIRRLGNKVIYEMKMPGVDSTEDISINQLENSIEIKATSKSKAYSKIIPISLPIKDYLLSKGLLVLELDAKD